MPSRKVLKNFIKSRAVEGARPYDHALYPLVGSHHEATAGDSKELLQPNRTSQIHKF